jgi:hypothetical protein
MRFFEAPDLPITSLSFAETVRRAPLSACRFRTSAEAELLVPGHPALCRPVGNSGFIHDCPATAGSARNAVGADETDSAQGFRTASGSPESSFTMTGDYAKIPDNILRHLIPKVTIRASFWCPTIVDDKVRY